MSAHGTIACQTALDHADYERVRHQAQRRNMTIREWVREQVMFGLEADEEDEAEARKRDHAATEVRGA